MRDALWLMLSVGAVAALWSWSSSGRERVLAVVKEVCADLNLQGLDDSVVLRGLQPMWTAQGLRVGRTYRFEFTLTGADRYAGDVGLAGSALAWVRVGHPEGDIHIDVASLRAG